MLRFLDCFKFEQPEPAPTVHAGHISEERFAWYRAPAVAQPHRSSSSLSSLDSSRGECHTSSAAEHAGDECLGAGDQGQQRRKQLPHEHQKQQQQPQQQPQLGKPLLGKGHQGSEWSHRGDASTSAAVQHCSIAPRSRPNSRAGGGGAEASMAGPWPVKLQQPRSRLGLAELAAGGSAVARLLQAADAFGGDDDDVDNCCPTCLEAYSESNPRITTECGHHFHLQCIYSWVERGKDTCPFCEAHIDPDQLLEAL